MSPPHAAGRSYTRIAVAAAAILSALGIIAWLVMPRQEDPTLPARFGVVTTIYPGADAETVERRVVRPLEDELGQVDVVLHIDTTARAGVSVMALQLRDDAEDTHAAWNAVREALARASKGLPSEALAPTLADDFIQQESIVLAVTGSADPLELRHAARRVRRTLLRLPGVARVTEIADPGEQVLVEVDRPVLHRMGLSRESIAAQLRSRSAAAPAGDLRIGDLRAPLHSASDFDSIADIESTSIMMPSGASISLADLARVRRGPREPRQAAMRHDGVSAIGLGIVARDGVQLVELGRDVRRATRALNASLAPLTIHEVSFQPDYVEDRLGDLGGSLALSVIIVAGVLLLFMGWRAALIVAGIVPVVTLGTLAAHWLGGGILHQMSIAGFIIALGMLVDSAIVVVDAIQAKLDAGIRAVPAAQTAVRELVTPLTVATATTVASFVPMLLASGATADFVRAVPTVICAALGLSLAAALVLVPAASRALLRPAPPKTRDGLSRLAARVGEMGIHSPRTVLGLTLLTLIAVAISASFVDQRFFPASDRNQMVVEVRLREGTHLARTSAAAARVEEMLMVRPDVRSVAAFVGRGVPRFYYNVGGAAHSPHVAQLLVTLEGHAQRERLVALTRTFITEELADAQGSVRLLEQGPHIRSPVEVRIFTEDDEEAQAASDEVLRALRSIPLALEARSDIDLGAPAIEVDIVDAAAGRRGATRRDVARALLSVSRGIGAGHIEGFDEAVPVVLRSSAGEETPIDALEAVLVATADNTLIPLGQLATQQMRWRPAARHHRDGRRMTRVTAQLARGAAFSRVDGELREKLSRVNLPAGVELEFGGAAEGAKEANGGILGMLPVGALLILVCLLWEFNSFRRTAIILATVPLSAAGIIPGLLLSGEPLGFMALFGVIALGGVVVNNAVVLLDVVERERENGLPIPAALATAVRLRTRPILLTTMTTVGGLLPLALGASTLWPPLAWAMMSGLTASTLLTLVVVPALYRLLITAPTERAVDGPSDGLGEATLDDEVTEITEWLGRPAVSGRRTSGGLAGSRH